jgi:hypothetical protein
VLEQGGIGILDDVRKLSAVGIGSPLYRRVDDDGVG